MWIWTQIRCRLLEPAARWHTILRTSIIHPMHWVVAPPADMRRPQHHHQVSPRLLHTTMATEGRHQITTTTTRGSRLHPAAAGVLRRRRCLVTRDTPVAVAVTARAVVWAVRQTMTMSLPIISPDIQMARMYDTNHEEKGWKTFLFLFFFLIPLHKGRWKK